MTVTGQVHSIETLAGLDGPGVRCVVFLQGCPLRCRYCHNPDTWNPSAGETLTSDRLVRRVLRLRPYFGQSPRGGGVTLSGGEPLMQAEFCAEVLAACRRHGVHTAIDTCGYRLDAAARSALANTDLVLLDIKHTDPLRHRDLTGAELAPAVEFLRYAAAQGIALWVRQVIVPGWNDTDEQARALGRLLRGTDTLEKVELLGYHDLAVVKWRELGMDYGLEGTPPASPQRVEELQRLVDMELKAPE